MNVNLSDADRKANHSLTNVADSTNMKVLNSDHKYVITINKNEVETIVDKMTNTKVKEESQNNSKMDYSLPQTGSGGKNDIDEARVLERDRSP